MTVSCLAAVFGVTVLANEVSKEVKVSNGTLSTKAGKPVLTTSTYGTKKADMSTQAITIAIEGTDATITTSVNAVVVQGETTTIICDDLVQVEESGDLKYGIREGSALESVLGGETEKRNLNAAGLAKVAAWIWKTASAAFKAKYGNFQTYWNMVFNALQGAAGAAIWNCLTGGCKKKR